MMMVPMNQEQAAASKQLQLTAHGEVLAGRSDIRGYARWLLPSDECQQVPLIIKETGEHTGSRVWEGSWLYLRWLMCNLELVRGKSVLELGAGCGLLGICLARTGTATSVTVSDFKGHGWSAEEGRSSVMDLLHGNVLENSNALSQFSKAHTMHKSSTLHVLEIDWATPQEPLRWQLPALVAPKKCTADQHDVILGTELLYSTQGASLLLDTLTTWMKRDGAFYLLNNVNRTGVKEFRAGCHDRGLQCTPLEFDQTQLSVNWSFGKNHAMDNTYVLFCVTWAK
tara:strand:+ start:2691 stop:3539 length:849 start_codon:yes stop_codon:yes gene_type:complete